MSSDTTTERYKIRWIYLFLLLLSEYIWQRENDTLLIEEGNNKI